MVECEVCHGHIGYNDSIYLIGVHNEKECIVKERIACSKCADRASTLLSGSGVRYSIRILVCGREGYSNAFGCPDIVYAVYECSEQTCQMHTLMHVHEDDRRSSVDEMMKLIPSHIHCYNCGKTETTRPVGIIKVH